MFHTIANKLLTIAFTTLLYTSCAPTNSKVHTSSSQTQKQEAPTPPTFKLPDKTQQTLLGITEDWTSSHISLQLYTHNGKNWKSTTAPWQGRIGKNGSSWGLGLHPYQEGPQKEEGDFKAPTGIFSIGGVWGYDEGCKKHPNLPYRKVTTRDLWIEDPASPYYNQHIVLDREPITKWHQEAQMKQGDYAHSLKVFIGHNAPPKVIPGSGSSIFFHIWREQGYKATAGCTTMDEGKLRDFISKLDPTKSPTYVMLTRADYNRLKEEWELP